MKGLTPWKALNGRNSGTVRDGFWEDFLDYLGYVDLVARSVSGKSNGGRQSRSMRFFLDFIWEANLSDPNL